MAEQTEIRASEGATHWYDAKTGEPRYTYVNKKGEVRNTTLREARKFGYVPSVTEVLKCAAKPALDVWKQEQVLYASLTLPRHEGEPEGVWLSRVREDAKETARKAAERGTLIHTYVQRGFEGEVLDGDAEIYFHVASEELKKHELTPPWICEKSFAKDGYGGKVDLHFPVIDIKTKDSTLEGIKTWDEHAMQLAAYRNGLSLLPGIRCGILFVSTKTVDAKLVWIEEKELQRGMKMFNALLDFWYAKSGLKR